MTTASSHNDGNHQRGTVCVCMCVRVSVRVCVFGVGGGLIFCVSLCRYHVSLSELVSTGPTGCHWAVWPSLRQKKSGKRSAAVPHLSSLQWEQSSSRQVRREGMAAECASKRVCPKHQCVGHEEEKKP